MVVKHICRLKDNKTVQQNIFLQVCDPRCRSYVFECVSVWGDCLFLGYELVKEYDNKNPYRRLDDIMYN